MADKDKDKAKVDLGLLEEDDEFEEFPAEGKIKQKTENVDENDKQKFNKFSDWVESTDAAAEEELSVWEDNWDDDNLETLDDFNEQLKNQMNKK